MTEKASPKPVTVVIGAAEWAAKLRLLLNENSFAMKRYPSAEKLISRLAEDHPALLLVDGSAADWQLWTVTTKIDSATRRIPVLVITADERQRRFALSVGADAALAPDDLLARFPEHLAQWARVQSDFERQALAGQCAQELPPLAQEGIRKFNAGEYYVQHDLFEEQWMAERGPVRNLYRAILQVGVAYYQITRGNHRGALKMLLRSIQWFAVLPDACQGVDLQRLREDARRVQETLESMNPAEIQHFDRELLKPVRLVGK